MFRSKHPLNLLLCGALMMASVIFLFSTLQQYNRVRSEWNALVDATNMERTARQHVIEMEQNVVNIRQRVSQYGMASPDVLIPSFILYVETLAQDEEVIVTSILPETPVNQFPMTQTPFRLALSGQYHALYRFFARLEKSQPPVQIGKVVVTRGEGTDLDVSFESALLSPQEIQVENRPRLAFATPVSQRGVDLLEPPSVLAQMRSPNQRKRRVAFVSHRHFPKKVVKKAPRPTALPKKAVRKKVRKPKLDAILYDGEDSIALLDGQSVSVGETHHGYRVISIQSDRIFLTDPHDRKKIVIDSV
ncbi:MAG: type 4a pilus biogenesis protein PilO [Nitrospiria bacterium]